MFVKYVVKHYSENRVCVYSAFAFDKLIDAIKLFNKLCIAYKNTHDTISIYEFSYADDMYFEVKATDL